jgi:hypothetical protein
MIEVGIDASRCLVEVVWARRGWWFEPPPRAVGGATGVFPSVRGERGGFLSLPQGLSLERRGLERPPPQSAAWAVCRLFSCGAPEGAGIVFSLRVSSARRGPTSAKDAPRPLRAPPSRAAASSLRGASGGGLTDPSRATYRSWGRPESPPRLAKTTLESPQIVGEAPTRPHPRPLSTTLQDPTTPRGHQRRLSLSKKAATPRAMRRGESRRATLLVGSLLRWRLERVLSEM